MYRSTLAVWLVLTGAAAAQQIDMPLCSAQDLLEKDVTLPDAIAFEPGQAATAWSSALGCSLVSSGTTRSTSGADASTKALVSLDDETLALLEILGPSPEMDAFARDLDSAVFTEVAALSDRRAVVFVSNPQGAEIYLGSTPYGVTNRVMGVRSNVLSEMRLVLAGHVDCAYGDATVRTEPDGTETVTCDLQPAP